MAKDSIAGERLMVIGQTRHNHNSQTEICVVRFYLITSGGPPHGSFPSAFDVEDALQKINSIPLSLEDGKPTRYMHRNNGKSLHTIIDESRNNLCFRLCEVRREDLPQTEKEGIVRELSLEEGQGLLENSYGIVFRPGLIGAISIPGVDMYRLGLYIRNKLQIPKSQLKINPLIASDVINRINNLEAISFFRLRISPSQLPIISNRWEGLTNTFNAQLGMWSEPETLEVIIRPARDSRGRARDAIISNLISLADPSIRNLLTGPATYKIKGRLEGRTRDVMLDVLGDSLTTEEQVLKSGAGNNDPNHRSAGLDGSSAYEAISRAYDTLEPEIMDALNNSNIQNIRERGYEIL